MAPWPHARAFASLTSSRGYELAAAAGITGNPQLSPDCLKCHATGSGHASVTFAKGFDLRDGVQCESCHGPGSGYSPEAIMLDKASAKAKGLLAVNEQTCVPCHENAHGKKFVYAEALKQIAHPTKVPLAASVEPVYQNPLNLAFTPNGRALWVACEASGTVVVIDPYSNRKVLEFSVGGQPNDVAFTPDGKRAFVSNRLDDNVSVVDVASHQVLSTIEVGDEPHGVLVDKAGRHLYVLNTSIDNISVIDVGTLKEVKRSCFPFAWSLASSPDARALRYPRPVAPGAGPHHRRSERHRFDTRPVRRRAADSAPGDNLARIAWHPLAIRPDHLART